jgi:hypothetical protein
MLQNIPRPLYGMCRLSLRQSTEQLIIIEEFSGKFSVKVCGLGLVLVKNQFSVCC